MSQSPEEKKDDDSFIREYTKSKPLNRKNLLRCVLAALLLGIVFGLSAAITYRVTTSVLTSGHSATADAVSDVDESGDAEDTSQEETDSTADTDDETQSDSPTDTVVEIVEQEVELSDLQKLKYELYGIGRTVGKSIVTVSATSQGTDLFQSDYEQADQNMGLVLSIDEETVLILTLYEPLSEAADIHVVFSDDTQAQAQVTEYDANVGLAVISVDVGEISDTAKSSLTAAALKTTGTVAQGQIVIAVGSPLGSVDSIVDGTITANGNQIQMEDSVYTIYTTSMLASEDGSGVLVNTDGEVIGIIMMEYNSESDKNTLTAISIKELYPLIEKLMVGEETAYLGVTVSTVTSSMSEEYEIPTGIYVWEVTEGSPAYEAGIQPGDVITRIGSADISSVEDLMEYLLTKEPDQTVQVDVMRSSGEEYAQVSCSAILSRK